MMTTETTTTTSSKENTQSNSFTVIVETKGKDVVTPPQSPKRLDVSKFCVHCGKEFLSNSADFVRCDECHRELVKAMNRWNTFLTARAYHPLKIVHASSSNNMKIRMKRCHVDWEWKYLWILSRLASLIDKSRGKTTTRFACSSIEAMRNKLRELRNDLLDGKFDTEVSISRITRDVWKRYLKSDKVAFDKTAREGYKCAFGLNAYFESMRGHSMRGFCYPSKLSVRGKRWYNASCGSKVYDVTMNDDDEEEEKDDEEEKMDVEEKSDETSQFALSKANIPKVMSRISAFIEPYGDFVYTRLRIGVRDDAFEMYQSDTMMGMESRARDCRGDVFTRAHMYCGGETIRRMWYETATITFPNVIEHPEKYCDVSAVVSEFITVSRSEPKHAGIMILSQSWEPASYDTAIFHISLRFKQLEKKVAIISSTKLGGEFQVALIARESLYQSDIDVDKLLQCFIPEDEDKSSKRRLLPIPKSAIWIGLVWRKRTVTPPSTPGVVASMEVKEASSILLDSADDAMDI
eukprot:g409.t1